MLDIPGYDVKEKVFFRSWYTIYRAISEKNGLNVLLKVINNDFKENIFSVEKEYDILKNLLHVEEVLYCYEVIKNKELKLIVFEDINGISIKEFFNNNCLNIKDVLELSIRIIKGINNIHRNGIIHKNINDSCILYNYENSMFRITDFKLASFSKKYFNKIITDKLEEVDLKFVSPEQSSIRNRLVDYRTDYYSFGVILYKMLTGYYPFEESDREILIYNQVNIRPKEIRDINKDITEFLNNVVMKLLEKDEEKRYQSGIGIVKDLEIALDQIENNLLFNNNSVAKFDYLQDLNIFSKIFSDEKKTQKINSIIEKSINGSKEIIMLTGYFITDKIEVIFDSYEFIKKYKGYYIIGEFENRKFKKPYSAIIDAFNRLASLIKKNKYTIFETDTWKFTNNWEVITEMFKDFEGIISKKDKLPVFFIEENINRFVYVLQEFFKICSSEKNPMMLILKNIHYADRSSIELLVKIFKNSELKYFTLIATYENENILEREILKDLRKIQSYNFYNEIFMQKIERKEIEKLLKKIFELDDKIIKKIGEIIIRFAHYDSSKFINVIKIFIKKKIIYYDKKWRYNFPKMKNEFDFDDLTEYLKYNVLKLSNEATKILHRFSAVENYVRFSDIEYVLNMSHREVYKYIVELIEYDIIVAENECYIFSDSKLKKYIYKNIKKEKLEEIHYSIINNYLKVNNEEILFEIVFHFYELKEVIKEDYKLYGCKKFLDAGLLFIKLTSYYEAYDILKSASEFLPKDSFNKNYDIYYKVMYNLILSSYGAKKYIECEKYCDILDKKIDEIDKKIEFYSFYIKVCNKLNKNEKVNNLIFYILDLNDIKVPKKINDLNLLKQKYIFNSIIYKMNKNNKLLKIVERDFSNDNKKIKLMKLMEIITDLYYEIDLKRYIFLFVEKYKYTLKNGNFKETMVLLISSSYFIYLFQNNLELGFKICKGSFSLLDKYNIRVYNLKARYIYNTALRFSIEPLKNSIEPLKYIFESAFEYGDFALSRKSAFMALNFSIYSGFNLKDVLADTKKYIKMLSRFDEFDISFYSNFKKIISTMNNVEKNSNYIENIEMVILDSKLKMNFFDSIEKSMLNIVKLYYIYILDDEDKYNHLKNLKSDSKYLANFKIDYLIYLYHFIEILSYLKVYKKSDRKMRKIIDKKANKIIESLKYSSNYCEYNFLHKYYILKAEYERFNDNYVLAKTYYKEAIERVTKTEFTNEEALCYELAAKFYFEYENDILGSIYIKRAYSCYKKLGITLKTENLKKKYIRYFKKNIVNKNLNQISMSKSNSLVGNNDLEYILKISQEISGELDEINFIRKILSKSIELIKSQKVIFLISEKNKFKIVGLLNENSRVSFYEDIYIEKENTYLAYKVIEICFSSKKKVIVNDATNNGIYNSDLYIRNNDIKSILCLPIKNKNNIKALLYFENNLSKNAYNLINYKTIEVFLNQISISYNNVIFYEDFKSHNVFLENRMKNKKHEIKLATKNYEDTFSNYENIKNIDILTGLLDRKEFIRKYKELMSVFGDKKNNIIVLKIENLNEININFGYQDGDNVLIKLSKILKKSFRDYDVISRWSGNEFVLIVYDIKIINIKHILENDKSELVQFFSKEYNKKIDINIIYNIKENKYNNDIESCIIENIKELV
jgi:diguanylate cyclase (GGDEF)-like protein